jgi:predicted amidohydrolase
VDVHLAAVQMAWSADDYLTGEAFSARVLELTQRAVAGAGSAPSLVGFPELVGLPLLLTAAGEPSALALPSFDAALLRLARRDLGRWNVNVWRQRRIGLAAVYATYAVDAYRLYRDAFVAAARATGAFIVAGSAFLPLVDDEPSLGLHLVDHRPFNRSLIVGPGGVLGSTAKVHLTGGREQRAGLVRGRLEDLHPIVTPFGRVAVAVCLDGFFEGVIGTIDGRGARIVVQPSANDAPWDGPWGADPKRIEGDVWLEEGLRARIQGRTHLRFGVNPMMVGDLLGLAPRGRSTIVANVTATGHAGGDRVANVAPTGAGEGRIPGIVAIAPDAVSEAIVAARVTLREEGDPGAVG